MTDTEKITFKNALKRWALDHIGQRITTSRQVIDQARESANGEEKSSAGDKYETGRAMGHLQQEMHTRQLTEYVKELAILHSVNTDQLCPEGRVGAFLQGEDIAFFIAAGLGKQVIEGKTIFFLSPQAPLAKFLQNKKPGDHITFNNINTTIQMVF
ncbi:MAG TPA: hypothetical protein VK518_19125 [Puia sp.]|nr:hypothetical protein [Puia sp.]